MQEVPLDRSPVFKAIAGRASQGGVNSTFFIGNLAFWSVTAILSFTPGWFTVCALGFGLTLGTARLLTNWDPEFGTVIARHLLQDSYYVARPTLFAPTRRVQRRKTYLSK